MQLNYLQNVLSVALDLMPYLIYLIWISIVFHSGSILLFINHYALSFFLVHASYHLPMLFRTLFHLLLIFQNLIFCHRQNFLNKLNSKFVIFRIHFFCLLSNFQNSNILFFYFREFQNHFWH